MFVLLLVLFVIVSALLGIFVLIQQGKGDMGMGSLTSSAQLLFGGAGGQSFLEKITWVLGALFILGALGLSTLKSRELTKSRLQGFVSEQKKKTAPSLPEAQAAEQADFDPEA